MKNHGFERLCTPSHYFRPQKWTFHNKCAFGAHIFVDFSLGNTEKTKQIPKNARSDPKNFIGAFGAEVLKLGGVIIRRGLIIRSRTDWPV